VGVAVRRKTDGHELERTGVVYLLQRTSAAWQFATVAIPDADDALRPEWYLRQQLFACSKGLTEYRSTR